MHFLKRNYSVVDLLHYRHFVNKNPGLKPIGHLKKYNEKYPELSEEQKLANLLAALDFNKEHGELTGEDIPEEKKWK